MSENNTQEREGLPPFIPSWRSMYLLLTVALVVQMIFYYLLMNNFQ